MPSPLPSGSPSRLSNKQLYCLGLSLILVGAWLMDHFGSVWLMAMCASAGLMLSAPLLRELWQGFVGRSDPS
jgi:hypothetical protein